jgi:hypothetical protein
MVGCCLAECGRCVGGVSYLTFSGGSEMVAWDGVRAKIRNTTGLLVKHGCFSMPRVLTRLRLWRRRGPLWQWQSRSRRFISLMPKIRIFRS